MILLSERKRERILHFVQNDGGGRILRFAQNDRGGRILRHKAPQNDRNLFMLSTFALSRQKQRNGSHRVPAGTEKT